MDTEAVQFQLDCLGEDAPLERVAEVKARIDAIKEAGKRMAEQWEAMMLERVQRDGDVVIGSDRYYAGAVKTTKCPDTAKGLSIIIDAAGGDYSKIAAVLKSDPFKHGDEVKELLGPRFADVFIVEMKPELKTGKPKLCKTNAIFGGGK